ncbi:maltase 1-like [Bicyclus anynana]|uniref:alpha-glucosidase n=1 Tax=Bicyclus anynana TaxID=110368 RepID=A0A6J1N7X2_BICAN|nr:maltase 1-like [Bicyclus anynana]
MHSNMRAFGITAIVVFGAGLIAGAITWAVLATRNNRSPPPPSPPDIIELDWWEHCVLYQIYPRSFKDSDADGIGDLKGITSELEHFKEAGVDAMWMSPIFESPMVDFGYDISNFYRIHHEYGTMEDFDDLLKKAHELGLKVLLDFVPNHASNQSDYFIRSEAREEGYEDFFVWADALEDPDNASNRLPPSNWVSQFGGSAWEWSEARRQFYLHQFAIEQPDFNFRNPAVKDELIKIMKFWLDKGVDGFRVDALPYMMEADPADHGGRYPDDPLSGLAQFEPHQLGYTIPLYTKDLIELYDIVYEWREFIDQYLKDNKGSTRVLFSEGYANVSMTMLYYGNEEGKLGAHFPFNFDFVKELSYESNARDFTYTILRWLTYMPAKAVANWQTGNHDNNRAPSRFRENMVDGLTALNLLLPGVAVTYQGEEIGMRDGFVSWEDTVDVEALRRGNNETYMQYSRDPCRTPYHWNNSTNAGFSTHNSTWLPVADDYKEINLAKQMEDARSHFKVYQTLVKLRKEKALSHGEYLVRALSDRTFYLVRYLRTFDTVVMLFNVADQPDTVVLRRVLKLDLPATVVVASIHSTRLAGDTIEGENLTLAAGEAVILRANPVP